METFDEIRKGMMQAAHNLRRINISVILDGVLQSEFLALEAVYRYHEAHGEMKGIYVCDLARELNMASSAVSRTLHGMEKKDLIFREVDASDRRNTYVCITDRGARVRLAAADNMKRLSGRIVDRMGYEDVLRLVNLWKQMSQVMAEEIGTMTKEGRNS